jgi:hypothetical protein
MPNYSENTAEAPEECLLQGLRSVYPVDTHHILACRNYTMSQQIFKAIL